MQETHSELLIHAIDGFSVQYKILSLSLGQLDIQAVVATPGIVSPSCNSYYYTMILYGGFEYSEDQFFQNKFKLLLDRCQDNL